MATLPHESSIHHPLASDAPCGVNCGHPTVLYNSHRITRKPPQSVWNTHHVIGERICYPETDYNTLSPLPSGQF